MSNNKIIKDCIYGHITIPDLCVSFMDVPEFQRLRRVRQLGMAHYAYPTAVHTRFEHSLGVMYLAGKMVDQLRKFATISDRVKELIQLGGLYHDIGHFAYSHLFDSFLARLQPNESVPSIFKLTHHEDRSLYFLRKVNSRLQLLTHAEEDFVCNVIIGHILPGEPSYLYQIVCNRECGIDVDRQDYLRRDSYHAGFPGFQSEYIILNTMIDSKEHIAYKSKVYNDIDDLYKARHRMFENVYQHHTSLKMDKIYFCMMKRLGNKLFIYGDHTDDYNIDTLLRNSEETKDLIQAIDNRELDQ
jgi:HD superfamily phosphohydrolase